MQFRNVRNVLGAAILAASVCSTMHAAMAATPETITVALASDMSALDPSKDSAPGGLQYRINVFDALVGFERDSKATPRLAVSWTYSPDLTEWTFKLRQGVKFHDGSAFTADDVVFTYQRIANDATSPVRSFVKLVKTVEKVDDFTVKFTLTQPYAIFDRQAGYIYIMSKTYFEKAGNEGYAKAPIGTGSYKFVSWAKDDKLVMEANANYWNGAPAIKKAIYRPIPSDSGRANALLSGEVDLVPELVPSLMDNLKANPALKVDIAPGNRVTYLGFDVTKAPVDNPLIREAIDVAIDRKSIAEKLLRGAGKPTGIMVVPMAIGYDASFKPVAYDPAKAKELVKQAGYKGEPIIITYPTNNFMMANEVIQAISGYMTAAGLKVETRPMEWTAFFPLWIQSKLTNANFMSFGTAQNHAETLLAVTYEKGSNAHFKDDPETDEMIKEQRKEIDPVKKQAIFSAIFKRSNENRWYIPLYDQQQIYAVRKTFDFVPFSDGVVRLYTIK